MYKFKILLLNLGSLQSPDHVLEWIIGEISGDHTVEVVTDAMLDRLISNHPHVAAFFYDKNGHEPSMKAAKALETIDDDLHDFSKIKLGSVDLLSHFMKVKCDSWT